MYNINAFRAYLKSLIGDQSQREFARQTSITPEHLCRMLTSKNPHRPSRITIEKLAQGNEDVYDTLVSLRYMEGGPWPVQAAEEEMTANEYQRLAARTINQSLTEAETEAHALYGMAAEVGELLELYQKRYQGHELEPEHVKKELGDICWMLAEFCTVNGWALGDIMQMNIEKLKKRYPAGFDADHSKHITDN